MKQERLNAVLDEDLQQLLKKVGEFERIERGEVYCSCCGIPITLKNIQILMPLADGAFEYVCQSAACMELFTREAEE